MYSESRKPLLSLARDPVWRCARCASASGPAYKAAAGDHKQPVRLMRRPPSGMADVIESKPETLGISAGTELTPASRCPGPGRRVAERLVVAFSSDVSTRPGSCYNGCCCGGRQQCSNVHVNACRVLAIGIHCSIRTSARSGRPYCWRTLCASACLHVKRAPRLRGLSCCSVRTCP